MLKQQTSGWVDKADHVLNVNSGIHLKNPRYFQLEQVINYEQKQRLLFNHSQQQADILIQ